MLLSCDLFWSFRSPYCYLALERILAMVRTYEFEVEVRPVYPLAIRSPEFFAKAARHYRRYNLLDTKRLADYLGISFRRPIPDPVVQNLEDSRIDARQPYIYRLTRLGMAAALGGRGHQFLDEVSRVIWDGTIDGWNEGCHLAKAVERAGLDLEKLDHAIEAFPNRYDELIQANQDALDTAGHWGVPTIVFRGEPFFGQDRLDLLLWRLKQNGLRKRVASGPCAVGFVDPA